MRPLADGDPAAVSGLGEALHGYHRAAVAPGRPRIRSFVDADRAVRARALLDGGADGLLHSMRPVLRWNPPVLEADYPAKRDPPRRPRPAPRPVGLCWRVPVTLIGPALDPVLVYPVSRGPGWRTVTGPGPER